MFEQRIPLLVRPREEGWLRHQENFGEAHLNAADGGGRSQATFSAGCPKIANLPYAIADL